ncbi:porin [Paraburkholderia caballeronis]|uniref:porin n=1 Tax=Paraburkholderia caballeronis TaxID=416943 RepID=UPI001064EF05|nr:porin [Paraburkholderia caballeronis]TDV19423.1 putative porin [Paraburkholderia caballeronis]TDV22023.1 putative porin [Paraburkholderia caballeronis]TDV28927.1 putative porin [Paraburkholderia caballeronis]
MNKTLLAVVAAGVPAIASAQSSVTLYGIIDEGISYTSNVATANPDGSVSGHSAIRLMSGVMQQSRWGLRGVEDLGGGLKTVFVLENGFDASTGKLAQGGLLFGKKAYVGLSGPFGTVTVGRQYDTNVDILGPFEVGDQWGGYMAAHPGDLDNFNNTNSTNNAIKFTSNPYRGFTVAAMLGLGGVAGDFARNRIWSASAAYVNGPFALGIGYLSVANPNTSFFGSTGSPAPTLGGIPGSNMASPVYAGFASARTMTVIGAGASWTVGAATLGATWSNTRFRDLGDAASGPNPLGLAGTALLNNAEVNFRYQFTPALLWGAAYDYTNGASVGGRDGATYHQVATGVDYLLSKRTDVYLIGVYQQASGTDSTGHAAVAAINGPSASANGRQAVVRVGMRHRF